VCGEELLQHQPTEQFREDAHRQDEARPAACDPALAIKRDAAARHDHVHVRMMRHGRAPGVEHGGDADGSAHVFRVSRDGENGLG
jgi:hypothetical protein